MRFGTTLPPSDGVAEVESALSPPEPLSSDATVDVDAERRATSVDGILDGLDRELVGLVPVKTRIREIAALLLVDRLRRQFGIESTRPSRKPITCVRMVRPPRVLISQKSPTAAAGPFDSTSRPTSSVTVPIHRQVSIRESFSK